jgi:hypothetical protein
MTTEPAWIIEARKHLDFHEGPDNKNPFGAHYDIDHQPWCALFVSFCCEKVGQPLPSMQSGMPDGYAGVYWGMQWAKSHGYWRPSWKAECGDAIVYGWDGANSSANEMHTGFIISSGEKGSTGHTIEGNRGDQVELQTFTVGADVVLGTIAITKILADIKGRKKKPPATVVPQPRHPAHPKNTGPTPKPAHPAKPLRYGPLRSLVVDGIATDLEDGHTAIGKSAKALDRIQHARHGQS